MVGGGVVFNVVVTVSSGGVRVKLTKINKSHEKERKTHIETTYLDDATRRACPSSLHPSSLGCHLMCRVVLFVIYCRRLKLPYSPTH